MKIVVVGGVGLKTILAFFAFLYSFGEKKKIIGKKMTMLCVGL